MELLLGPDGLMLFVAILFATLAFGWVHRRRRASWKLLLAGSAALFCGVLSTALVFTTLAVFLARRIAEGADPMAKITWVKKVVVLGVPYDMRLYGVLLLSVVLLLPSFRCIKAAAAVVLGAKDAWKTVVQADMLLLAITVPLLPLQSFAPLVAAAAFLSLEIAFAARNDLTGFAKRRAGRVAPARSPEFDSVRAG